MQDSTKNRWFWGQFGIGTGQYAYCPACKDRVSARIVQGKSYCKSCNAEIEWKDKNENNSN